MSAHDDTRDPLRDEANDETVVDEATIVVAQPQLDDRTVVVARPVATVEPEVDDGTIVVTHPEAAAEPVVDDGTIVVTHPEAAAEHAVDDGTIVVSRPDVAHAAPGAHAAPVAPQAAPWEEPRGVVGVHPDVPVVYGPRAIPNADATVGGDEIARRIGPAPAAVPVPVRTDRADLPALTRREQRRRRRTLVLYPVAVVIAIVGLTVLGFLAFG